MIMIVDHLLSNFVNEEKKFLCYFSWVYQYKYHLRLHKAWQPKMNNKKYNKDFVRLLGLLQTIRGEQGKPLTGKQGLQSERLLWIMDGRNI